MRKLSDINGEEALDVLADIVDPFTEILTDEEVATHFKSGQRLRSVTTAIKKHKREVLLIMATIEGVDVADYKPNILTLPGMIIEMLNDPAVQELFSSESQTDAAYSGSATGSTEVTEKK